MIPATLTILALNAVVLASLLLHYVRENRSHP